MRNFILVISVALIATNAYAWGTSQTAVQPEHEIKKVEEFKGVPEAERLWNEKHKTQKVQSTPTQPVEFPGKVGEWTSGGNTIFQKLDKDAMLMVTYNGEEPVVGVVFLVQDRSRVLAPRANYTKYNGGFKSELTINGQRLIGSAYYQIDDTCGMDGMCQQRIYNENPIVTARYLISVASERGNLWAYQTLATNKRIEINVNKRTFNVDLSGFKEIDAKHSVAF